jgi:polysaccharide biosynthesis transport protein
VENQLRFAAMRDVPASSPQSEWLDARQIPVDDEFGLWNYWAIVRAHYRLILGLIVSAELVALLLLHMMTTLYTGVSTIMIERESPPILSQQSERNDSDGASFYRTQYGILQSRSLAAAVIHELKLSKNPAFATPVRKRAQPRGTLLTWFLPSAKAYNSNHAKGKPELYGIDPRLIDSYLKTLTIRPELDTRLVTVGFTSPDPALAGQVANAHVQAYINKSYELRNQNSEVERRYLQGELVGLEKHLESSESALNGYRRQRGIVTLSEDGKDQTVAQRLTSLTSGLVAAEEARIDLGARVEALGEHGFDSAPEVIRSRLIQNLKIEAARIDGKYANLANQFTPDYPPVAQLKAQVRNVHARLQSEIQRVVAGLRAKYRAAQDRENQLKAAVEKERSRILALKDASLQDAVLAREVETNRALYKNVLERIKVLGVASHALTTNVSVVDAAETPLTASSPKTLLSLVLTGFLALLVGVGLAFLADDFNHGIKDASDVHNYLGLQNLATVGRFSELDGSTPLRELLTIGHNIDEGDPRPQLNRETAISAPLLHDSRSLATEAYRAVRTSIMLVHGPRRPKTILFTSSVVAEGKSVTAVNTAVAFGKLAERVLLIDSDLRRPRCHHLLGVNAGPGLTEFLTGSDELDHFIQPTLAKNVFLLSAGGQSADPTELLGSKRMRELLARARSDYDYVLIDSPPILPVSDSVILSPLIDGVVMIIGDRTPRQAVRDACSRLLESGAAIIGAILNNVDLKSRPHYGPYMYY